MSAIQRQITSTTKAICLAKDEAVATGAECALFQKEIESKASIIEGHRLKLRRHKQARMSLESLSIKYRERMAKHGTRTQEVEQKSAVQQELEAATDKVIKLREKSEPCLNLVCSCDHLPLFPSMCRTCVPQWRRGGHL